MKKYQLILSASLVSLALVACGQNEVKKDTINKSEKTSITTKSSEKTSSTKILQNQKTTVSDSQTSQTTENDESTTNQSEANTTTSNISTSQTKDDASPKQTVNETELVESTMSVDDIQAGDYSSIAGKWVNGKGQVLVFDESGLVDDYQEIRNEEQGYIDDNGNLLTNIGVKHGGGGAAIMFIPAGHQQIRTNSSDQSDSTKDRIWIGQQEVANDEAAFYYKVK